MPPNAAVDSKPSDIHGTYQPTNQPTAKKKYLKKENQKKTLQCTKKHNGNKLKKNVEEFLKFGKFGKKCL